MLITPAQTITLRIGDETSPILDPGPLQAGDIRWYRDGDPGQLAPRRMKHSVRVEILDASGTVIQAVPVA